MADTALYPKLITDALATVRYPGTGKNIVEMGMVEDDIRIEGRKVSFSIKFSKPTDPFIKSIVRAAEAAILTHVGSDIDIKGNIAVKTPQQAAKAAQADKPLPGVKNIIGVSSGKGGVASRRWPATWPCRWRSWATKWACSTPTSSGRRCPKCLA